MTRQGQGEDGKVATPGVVYTRDWVAELILDLVGYVSTENLAAHTIVEPSCGEGVFVVAIVRRLLLSARAAGIDPISLPYAVCAVDLSAEAVARCRERVFAELRRANVDQSTARHLTETWVRQADFLVPDLPLPKARWVVGNPPYVRVEEVDVASLARYRTAWNTMTGRSDLYVGFFQAALQLLDAQGVLGFLCADRWMKNTYGAALRELVTGSHHLDLVLDVHAVDAFVDQVDAYPAITVIQSRPGRRTTLVEATRSFGPAAGARLLEQYRAGQFQADLDFSGHIVNARPRSRSGWAFGDNGRVRRYETSRSRWPALEETGITVSSGLATGADSVYIVAEDPGVETDRLLRIVGPPDMDAGRVTWTGRWLVSPWKDGRLINLDAYPLTRSYFLAHRTRLLSRRVARDHPESWWRTIDKPRSADYADRKLLVPDIKSSIEPTLDDGGHVPMHSLYYLRSTTWPLEELAGLLLSDQVHDQLEAVSVRMASGRLRVSAQYLRRLHVPPVSAFTKAARSDLRGAFEHQDAPSATSAVATVMGRTSG